jgi:hypothetical protein
MTLAVVAFNANGIGRQRYELSKQLQDHRIEVALVLETYLKPHEWFFISNYHVYPADRLPVIKCGTTFPCFDRSHRDLQSNFTCRYL